MARDTMRQRSYDWEDDLFGTFKTKGMEYAEVPAFVRRCAAYVTERMKALHGHNSPSLAAVSGLHCPVRLPSRNSGFARGGVMGVTLPQWAWNPTVICHEVAHWAQHVEAAAYCERSKRDPGHGAHWLGWYVALLSRFCHIAPSRMVRSATFYGLTIEPKCARVEEAVVALSNRKGLRSLRAACRAHTVGPHA